MGQREVDAGGVVSVWFLNWILFRACIQGITTTRTYTTMCVEWQVTWSDGFENMKIRWYYGHILKFCWKYLCLGLCFVLTRVAMELIFSKWRKTSLLQCDAARYNSSLAGGPKCAKAEKTITLSIHQTQLITSWLVPGSTGYIQTVTPLSTILSVILMQKMVNWPFW